MLGAPATEASWPDSARVASDLEAAFDSGCLMLYYQPVVSLVDRSTTTLEALPRWHHPDRGVLAPTDFLAAAEAHGMLDRLETWAINTAMKQLARWSRGIASQLSVTLNLSEHHAFHGGLAKTVAEAAAANDVSPERLGFEITESALLSSGPRRSQMLEDLESLGTGMIVDSYTGAAGASDLQGLPITGIKTARQIAEGIPDDRGSVQVACAAINLGEELEIEVIASGIENPGQAASLRELGCPFGQGFLFAVPMPADALEERLPDR